MATDTTTTTPTPEQRLNELRTMFEDAPEVGRKAMANVLHELTSQASTELPPPIESAGSRLGKVSELTLIVPLAPGGCARSCGC